MASQLYEGGIFQRDAVPWWLTFKQNPYSEYANDFQFYDKTTGKQVYQDASGNFFYELPRAERFDVGEDGQWQKIAGTPGQAVTAPADPLNAEVLGASGVNGLAQIRLADGTVTTGTALNGDAGDYSKLFEGMVPGSPGYMQVPGQGASETQVVKGSDGNYYAAQPSNAQFVAARPDNSGIMSNFMNGYAPLITAALPFTGIGGMLTNTFGDVGGRALLNAGTSLLTGGDPIMGAVKGGAGALINPALADAGIPSAVAPFITNAAISGATGGDVGQSLLNTALNTGIKSLGGLFDSPTQVAQTDTTPQYQYTMSGGDQPSSVSVENIPQDMTGFQTPQSTDPAQIWQTPETIANQPPASDYLNAPVSGAPQMDMYDNSGGWTPDFSTNNLQSLWPTSGDTLTGSPVQGTPADNYMNSGNLFDYSGAPMGGTYNFNTGGYNAGTPTQTPDPGVLGYLKQALGIGAAAGGVAGGMGGGAGGNAGSLLGGNGGLLLPLLGGLLGSMSGGAKPAGTTTTINDIPDWQKPYVTNAFGAAGNALNDANAAYAATKPTTDLATNNLNATLRGDYLGSNPALDGMFNTAANSVANKVNSAFSSAGRYGSGAQTSTLTEGLGNLANNIYGQNYQQERQRQFAGSLAAPSYSQGTTQAAYGPASGYANIVRQPVGSTQSSPYFTNPLGGAVSGLLGGYALSRA